MTTRRLIICLATLALAVLACTAPAASTPIIAPPLPTQTIVLTNTPLPATSVPLRRPTLEPSPSLPAFSHTITFAETPDITQGQRQFRAGVTQIYALWSYANMVDGMVIRRDWYLDGELWITREEPWSFAKYGPSGTVTDVSIHDLENGLDSGHYELRLYIDNVPQFGPADDVSLRSFDIAPPADGGN